MNSQKLSKISTAAINYIKPKNTKKQAETCFCYTLLYIYMCAFDGIDSGLRDIGMLFGETRPQSNDFDHLVDDLFLAHFGSFLTPPHKKPHICVDIHAVFL